MTDLTGQTIRGYTVRDKIGEGGYGIVYRAHQASVEREVAVKVILPQYANQPEFARRFEREAQLIAQLEHPHIVPLHDYWRDESGAYLVMRFVRGGSLRDLLRDGPLPLERVLHLLDQVCAALDFAHRADIIHRDLKPDNILLDTAGNAYLSDFGMAKLVTGEGSITQTDGVAGTPAYITPEQIEGGLLRPQTDIYSLGVMLYELLTGQHPYTGSGALEMIVKHVQEPLPSLGKLAPHLPESLDVVIQRATAKDPDDRYPDAPTVATDFRALSLGDGQGGASLAAEVQPPTRSARAPQAASDATTRETPRSPEQRNRRRMLNNVRAFWIDGLLENSLYGATLIDLGLAEETGHVDNPWDVLLLRPGEREQVQPPNTPVIDLFDRLTGSLLILGDPGSGKTTTLLELARDLLHRAERDPHHPIPVVLNLSSWAEAEKPLEAWLVDELREKYQAPRRVAQGWVEDDALLLLLDGLDEVPADQRDACVDAINAYREAHGFVELAVCSRSVDYEALTSRLRLNGAAVIQPLNDAQIDAYLAGLGPQVGAVRQLLHEDDALREMARTPLMLSVMTLAYRGQTADDLPRFDTDDERRQHLFDVYVQRMFSRRLEQGGYPEDETRRLLAWLADRMQTHAQSVFQIEGIQPAWLTPNQKGRYHRLLTWTHVVLQALGWGLARLLMTPFGIATSGIINGLVWALAGAYWGWLIGSDRYRYLGYQVLAAALFALAVAYDALIEAGIGVALLEFPGGVAIYGSMVYGAGVIMRRSGYERDRVVAQDQVRFSWNAVKLWLVVTSFFAGILTVYINLDAAQSSYTDADLLLALGTAAIMGSLTGLYMGGLTSSDVGRSQRPNATIQRMGRGALQMGAVVLVMFFLIVFFATTPIGGPAFGLVHSFTGVVAFGVNGAIMYGGYPVIQHLILRRVLARDGDVPRNYARFLDHAVGLILLRRVGGSYVFIHRTLLEYFAQSGTPGADRPRHTSS